MGWTIWSRVHSGTGRGLEWTYLRDTVPLLMVLRVLYRSIWVILNIFTLPVSGFHVPSFYFCLFITVTRMTHVSLFLSQSRCHRQTSSKRPKSRWLQHLLGMFFVFCFFFFFVFFCFFFVSFVLYAFRVLSIENEVYITLFFWGCWFWANHGKKGTAIVAAFPANKWSIDVLTCWNVLNVLLSRYHTSLRYQSPFGHLKYLTHS